MKSDFSLTFLFHLFFKSTMNNSNKIKVNTLFFPRYLI